MEKNKTGMYFKYAIGEIVLVVIGILIALSINNWNESRKVNHKLNAELKELKSELLSNYELINRRLISLKDADIYGQYLQDFTNDNLEEIDTLKLRKAIYYTGYLLVFERTKTAYQNLVNQGDIQYITSFKLKQDLALFYNENSWGSSYHNDVILSSFKDYLSHIHKFTKAGTLRSFYEAEISNVETLKLDGEIINEINAKNGSLVDWTKLKNDPEFKVLIDKVQTNRFVQIYQYETSLKNEIENLVKLIDDELKRF